MLRAVFVKKRVGVILRGYWLAMPSASVKENRDKEQKRGKDSLQFGKASMYVIYGCDLQTESVTRCSGQGNDKEAFLPVKSAFISRTRTTDFNSKETANGRKPGKKLRVLDLNSAVGVEAVDEEGGSRSRPRYLNYAGTLNRIGFLNEPPSCLNAPGYNTFQNKASKGTRRFRLAPIRPLVLDEFKMRNGVARRKWRQDSHGVQQTLSESTDQNCDTKTLSLDNFSCGTSSLRRETARANSLVITEKQKAAENSAEFGHFPGIALTATKMEVSEKYDLKKIFYSKGNALTKPDIVYESLAQLNRKALRKGKSTDLETEKENDPKCLQKNQEFSFIRFNRNISQTKKKEKDGLPPVVMPPRAVDKNPGIVNLPLRQAITYEKRDYNKWSRRQNRIKH